MKNIKGNLFDISADAICITTNGFVKSNGSCVMGRGCAKELLRHYPKADLRLGKLIGINGNIVQQIASTELNEAILAFPVKPVSIVFDSNIQVVRHMRDKFKVGDIVPGWACVADMGIIRKSCEQLVKLTDKHNWNSVIIPRPGCGAGELKWEDVEQVMQKYMDDRFSAITFA